MNTKHLKFGPSKCFRLHVGATKNASCSVLKVHEDYMNDVTHEKYLGQVISSDSKVDLDFEERYNKGISSANQIISILEEAHFSQSYYETAMMFRTSMMINSMLCSAEALYGVSEKNLDKLSTCDTYLMRQLFNTGKGCPIIAFFLETNCIPLHLTLKARRLMFLWNILAKSDVELVKQVLKIQLMFPVKNDWVNTVKNYLTECNTSLTFDEISLLTKQTFKRIVKQEINNLDGPIH